MFERRILLAAALVGMLAMIVAACGGGAASAEYPPARSPSHFIRMMVRGSNIDPVPGANSSVSFPDSTDPVASTAQQAALPGDVVLTMVPFKDTAFLRLAEWITAALSHPNVPWVYLYDELFWEGGTIKIGEGEQPVIAAAQRVHAAGLKTVVSIMPDVILDAAFALAQPNAFDVIAIDDYPSIRLHQTAPGCPSTSPNLAVRRMDCSVQKLRRMGYSGEVWYVYQAFGDSDDADLVSNLEQQREAIRIAPALGFTGLVAFGFFDTGTGASAIGAPLYPGKGTPIEPLVSCMEGCTGG